jgi:hypothetical protein
MSEFYAQRRTSIKDGVALFAFIAGWFAAAPYGWPYISRGFDDGGNAARGVFIFLAIVFVAGIIAGASAFYSAAQSARRGSAIIAAIARLRRRRMTRPTW